MPSFVKKVIGSVGRSTGMAPNFPFKADQVIMQPGENAGIWTVHAGHHVNPQGVRAAFLGSATLCVCTS